MKLTRLLSLSLCLCVMMTTLNAQVSFAVASSGVSPNTTRTISQYTIQLNAITSFSTNFDLSVTFPSAFSLGLPRLLSSVSFGFSSLFYFYFLSSLQKDSYSTSGLSSTALS